nr:LdpA C-terminal domain-containing domain [Tychonema sp. LEGE 07203]
MICGASFQHLPAVRNLTLAYTLAGADCIDVAADPAAVAAAKEGLQVAGELQARTQNSRFGGKGLPWLMVSLNDGEDPHFRKAEFNPADCPPDCWRPCEKICPASAIVFQEAVEGFSGVIDRQCYGCGRCLPVCPSQLIYTRSYVSAPAAIAPLILQSGADALEIHTQVGREADFARLWSSIAPWVDRLKLIAISCPDGDNLIDYLRTLYQIISPLPCPLIWQTDGRPMSGDIGTGTTRAAVKLGQKVLAAQLPGFVQLAGGTNDRTVSKLRAGGLMRECRKNLSIPDRPHIAGIAYGSYARVLLSPILEQLDTMQSDRAYAVPVAAAHSAAEVPTPRLNQLEAVPELLSEAVSLARSLVSQIKSH